MNSQGAASGGPDSAEEGQSGGDSEAPSGDGDGDGADDEAGEAESGESTDGAGEDEGPGFVPALDVPYPYCNPDEPGACPEGEACKPSYHEGWGSGFSCLELVEVPDGIGESCTSPFDVPGVDTCEAGAACRPHEPVEGEGTCRRLCTFDVDPNHGCVGEERCLAFGQEPPFWCYPPCDALDPEACHESRSCLPTQGTFYCRFLAEELHAEGEGCSYANECEPGLFCASKDVLDGCDSEGCCTSFCTLEDPESCGDAPLGSHCRDLDVNVPESVAHIGYCGQD